MKRLTMMMMMVWAWALVGHGQTTIGLDRLETEKVTVTASSELTIASGAVTVTGSHHTVDTEADASSDDLATISGGADGQVLMLRAANDARTVTVVRTGNIEGAADVTLDDVGDAVMLIYRGSDAKWSITAAGAAGGGGGVTTWVNLTDTPSAYTGHAGKYVRVTTGEDGLEFATVAGGGSGTMTTVEEGDSQVGGADMVTLDLMDRTSM